MTRFPTVFIGVLLSSFILMGWPSFATTVYTPLSTVSIYSSADTVEPGTSFYLMLEFQLKKGWHTYWKNPGDSGLPLRMTWNAPKTITIKDPLWPAPEIQPLGGLTNYGYKDQAFVIIPVSASSSLVKNTEIPIHVSAKWLVCKETCIPDQADISLTLSSGQTQLSPYAGLIQTRLRQLPSPRGSPSYFRYTADTIELLLEGVTETDIQDIYFFPEDATLIDHSKAQSFRRDHDLFMRRTRFF